MDTTTVVLIVTHAAAFIAGGWTVRRIMVRNLRVTNVDGHLALEVRPCGTDDEQETP